MPPFNFTNFTTSYAEVMIPDYAATRILTVAEVRTRLDAFRDNVETRLEALGDALLVLQSDVADDAVSLADLLDILNAVRTASTLMDNLEGVLRDYADFFEDYGHQVSVPFRVRNAIIQAQATVASARADLAEMENAMLQSFSNRHAARVELSVDTPINWDENVSLYQATSIAHGHMLTYRVRLKANGYSLGEMQKTVSLGPGQKRQIAILEYSREDTARRDEALDSSESLEASLSRDRTVSEVMRASVKEKIKGRSFGATGGISSGGGASAAGSGSKGPFKGAAGGTAGIMGSLGVSGAMSSQKSSRNIAASSMQRLRERINQSSAAVRSQRATVVETVSQTERVSASTEVISNRNLCHAVNYVFSSVLKHYVLETDLVEAGEVLFVPLQITPYTPEKILRWKSTLYDFVPGPDYRAGFDDIAALEAGSSAPNQLMADEVMNDITGEMSLSFDLPIPDIRDPELTEAGLVPAGHNFGSAWSFYASRFHTYFTHNYYLSYLHGRLHAARTQRWRDEIKPALVRQFIEQLEVHAVTSTGRVNLDLDVTQLTRYREGARMSLKLRSKGTTPTLRRSDVESIEIRSGRRVPSSARILIESASLAYRSQTHEGFLLRESRLRDDIGNADLTRILTPLSPAEMVNPAEEQRRRANQLIEHLNANREVYHEITFKEMDEHKRFMLLDGIRLPSAGNQSVANLVQNRVVGVVGNSIILPVVPGLRIDPVFRDVPDLLKFYTPVHPAEAFRMSLPTDGYFMEAVMGSCSSCEELDYTRARFHGFASDDEPTAIEPVSMDSRFQAPSDLTAKNFAGPIVAFQNAPEAPGPQGYAKALDTLASGDMFRDATGLAATQAGALAAMNKTADGATSMAKISSDLTKQAFAGIADRTVDRDLERIEEQAAKGNLSDDDKQALIKKTLGGKQEATVGKSPEPEAPAETAPAEEVSEKIIEKTSDAVKPGGRAKVRTKDKKGNETEIEIDRRNSPRPTRNYPGLGGDEVWSSGRAFLNENMRIKDLSFSTKPLIDYLDGVFAKRFTRVGSSDSMTCDDFDSAYWGGDNLREYLEQSDGVLRNKLTDDGWWDWSENDVNTGFGYNLPGLGYDDGDHTYPDDVEYTDSWLRLFPQFDLNSTKVFRQELINEVTEQVNTNLDISGKIDAGADAKVILPAALIDAAVKANVAVGYSREVKVSPNTSSELEISYTINGRVNMNYRQELYHAGKVFRPKKIPDFAVNNLRATVVETINITRDAD